ncbi:PKD domain-containing protein [Arthrobacter sp. H14-L1]|uniref:PKD domain-containing protein n=1 Tax=Arthrobacter sp. H14-L1 TaxID=2996697 RepID=UPI00226DC035|nr:PKD domain-containing protein [Arthrobacter sp. H14-L1]
MGAVKRLLAVLATVSAVVGLGLATAITATAGSFSLLYSYTFGDSLTTVANAAPVNASATLSLKGSVSVPAGGAAVHFDGDTVAKASVGIARPTSGPTMSATAREAYGAVVKFTHQLVGTQKCFLDSHNYTQIGRFGTQLSQMKIQASKCSTNSGAVFPECRVAGSLSATTIPVVRGTQALLNGMTYLVSCIKDPDGLTGKSTITLETSRLEPGGPVTTRNVVTVASTGAFTSYEWLSVANKYPLPVASENTDQVVGDVYRVAFCKAGSTPDVQSCLAQPAPANRAPVAAFTSRTTGLSVAVDASSSTDSDGTVVSSSWTFGDGSSAGGSTAAHAYAAAGTYTITLTVTDDQGATGTATKTVSVTTGVPAQGAVTFRGASQTNVNSTAPSLTAPTQIKSGDGLLLFATVNSTAPAAGPPSGSSWRLIGSRADGSVQTFLWAKTANASDAGSTITVPLGLMAKAAVQLVAYSGVTGPNWIDSAVSDIRLTSENTRTTPKVAVSSPGSTLVSYWANKSSVDNGWAADPTVIPRSQTTGIGGGRITSLLGDSAVLAPGDSGQIVATPLASPDTKCAMWSVVLRAGA